MSSGPTTADALAMARVVKSARIALIDAVRRGLGTTGLGAAHTQVFEALDPDGTRVTTLAQRARMSHQAMGELVTELVDHGFLERVPDPTDRRARRVRPTDRGRAELARAAEQLTAIRIAWERQLTGVTADQVLAGLEAFVQVCEKFDQDG